MAIQCTLCGTALKDDARFCNNCGTFVSSSHPLSPKSTVSSTPPIEQTNPTGNANNSKAVIREQIAQQPPYRPARRPVQNEPPSWISQLDSEVRRGGGGSSKGPSGEGINAPQLDFPVPEPIHRSNSPVRELRVKVWEQEEPAMPGATKTSGEGEEDGFDDLPTGPLVAGSPGMLMQQNATLSPARKTQDTDFDEVERLDTVPLATQMGVKPASRPRPEQSFKQSRPQQQAASSPGRSGYQEASSHTPSAPYNHIASSYSRAANQPVQDYRQVSSAPPAQEWRQTPPQQAVVSALKRRKSRKPLVIVLISLFILVIGGSVGTWIILKQPFSVPIVTQPQQSFTNTQLGLSLLYPNGWKSQVDQGKATVHFYDSSNTAQVNIMVAASSGGDLGQYLQQVANQLGMTGVKSGAPISFGGASWQQVQGTVLQRGASYSGTLFVTTHNKSKVTLIFLAPQTTYAQEDQFVFSSMRSSFQFLP